MTERNIHTSIAARTREERTLVVESPAGAESHQPPDVSRDSDGEPGRRGESRRKPTRDELVRAIWLDLAAEQEVVHLYLGRADIADHPRLGQALQDLADEESAHVREFARLLSILAPEEGALMEIRARKVDALRGAPAVARPACPETELGGRRDLRGG